MRAAARLLPRTFRRNSSSTVDTVGEGVSRLVQPGSKIILLRPPGWGKSTMVSNLNIFYSGGEGRKKHFGSENSWIVANRRALMRQPRTPVLSLDFETLDFSQMNGTDMLSFLVSEIEQVHEREKSNSKIALLVDNYDAKFVAQDCVVSEDALAALELLKCACDLHDNVEKIGYIFVTGVYRVSIGDKYGDLMQRFKDISLDIFHHNTLGIGDETVRNMCSAGDGSSWVSNGRIRAPSNSRIRKFRWDNAKGDREELDLVSSDAVRSEDIKPDTGGGVMRAVSSSQRKIVAHAVEDGGYWWGGHDSRGVPELIAPHTKPQGLHVPLPSSADIVDTVRSLFLFHKLEDFIDGCYCPQQGKIPHSDHEDRSHFPAILLQSGLLTIGQRIVRFDEFHTYAFVKLCFPNENQRKDFLSRLLCTWLQATDAQVEEIFRVLGLLGDAMRSGGEQGESIERILSQLREICGSLPFARGDEGARDCLMLLLLYGAPGMQLFDPGSQYVDGGPVDTFVEPSNVEPDPNNGSDPHVLVCSTLPDAINTLPRAEKQRSVLLCDSNMRQYDTEISIPRG